MAAGKEKLPPGFARRASGALRVQIRRAGFSEVRNFSLMADTAAERRRQMAEAEAWASETRRRIVGGSHVSTREAERITLANALERYAREGLKGEAANAAKDRTRINILLDDPIARKALAQLRKTDLVALRDRLLEAGFLRSASRVARKLVASGGEGVDSRIVELAALKTLVREAKDATGPARPPIEVRIAEIVAREGVKYPARSTIANIVQLVTRSLKHAAQTIEGVPDLTGVPMPAGTPGRERRVSDDEFSALEAAADGDALMPLILRFAVATTLRRERLLACRISDIRPIGAGRLAIAFSRSTRTRRKRTGIVPVTREIREIIESALRLQGYDRIENAPDVPLFPLTLEAFESRWKRLLAATDLLDLHFHDMRHEGTSRLFERGLTTAEVMSITGHSTQEMVDRYSHYSAALVLEKLEKGQDEAALLAEITFLTEQFAAIGGDRKKLSSVFVA